MVTSKCAKAAFAMAVGSLVIYSASANPKCGTCESYTRPNEMPVRADGAHAGLTIFGPTFGSYIILRLGEFLTHCKARARRLASSCHKSDCRSQINTARGEDLNCDNQSVRISRYSGSHMESHTWLALKVNEFTEAKMLRAKSGLGEWDSRLSCVYLTSIKCICGLISKFLILTLTLGS